MSKLIYDGKLIELGPSFVGADGLNLSFEYLVIRTESGEQKVKNVCAPTNMRMIQGEDARFVFYEAHDKVSLIAIVHKNGFEEELEDWLDKTYSHNMKQTEANPTGCGLLLIAVALVPLVAFVPMMLLMSLLSFIGGDDFAEKLVPFVVLACVVFAVYFLVTFKKRIFKRLFKKNGKAHFDAMMAIVSEEKEIYEADKK